MAINTCLTLACSLYQQILTLCKMIFILLSSQIIVTLPYPAQIPSSYKMLTSQANIFLILALYRSQYLCWFFFFLKVFLVA